MAHKKRRSTPSVPPTPKPAGDPMEVSLADHPEPAIAGFATACAIIPRDLAVEIIFFDENKGSPVIVSRFYALKFDLDIFWRNTTAFFDLLSREAEKGAWTKPQILTSLPGSLERPRTPAPLCTAFPVAKAGMGALLQCYYISASSIFRAASGVGRVNVVPVFAIQMPLQLMLSFLSHVQDLVSTTTLAK